LTGPQSAHWKPKGDGILQCGPLQSIDASWFGSETIVVEDRGKGLLI